MSHWTPVETLESRTLLAVTPLDWPFQGIGASRIGRTLYMRGTDGNDQIRIDVVPTPTGGTAPKKVQLVVNNFRVNNAVPQLPAQGIRRVLITGAGGDDSIIIATGLTPAFHPRLIIIRGGAGNDTITGGTLNETIFGESGDDTINGGAGVDRIDGGDGNDTITGGAGRDVLVGGLGNDTFKNREPDTQRPESGPTSPRDLILGGGGNDNAQADPADIIRDDVENKNAT